MSSLLYYSISSGLTKNEIIEIDKEVAINRKAVYLFVRKLPYNSNRKAKRLCLYLVFMCVISQPLDLCAPVVLSSQNYSNATSLTQEKVISNQEFNSLDGSHNSSKIIRTGNGTILELQQKVSETNSTYMDEVILVKNDGLLPGADGFSPNNYPRKPHYIPRIRGKSITADPPQNIQGLGNIPEAQKVRSFKEVDTSLNGQRGNRGDQCPAPKFDMKKEYENFMQEISEKGYELECSQERFNELSTNPKTDSPDEKSLIEAKGGLQGEAQGMYTNIRRPSNKAVDLDFEINSLKGYTHVDFKTPIDFQELADKKKIDVSNFPNLETVGYNMGKKIPPQKKQFCGLPNGPKSPENVLHVVNLDLIKDSQQKQNMIDSVLKGAEEKSNKTVGIYFLNYL